MLRRALDDATVADIERRLRALHHAGADDDIEALSGGLANLTVRIGRDRVLRVYERDPATLRKEQHLLMRPWHRFRVPRVLGDGVDHLLLEYVAHSPLQGAARHGAAAGRALAEIHARRYRTAGLLRPDLEIATPFDDFAGALIAYAVDTLQGGVRAHLDDLPSRITQYFAAHADELQTLAREPVLLHGDYKVSNLHWTPENELLVLDWEFAYAGPAAMDIGQLFRWDTPPAFRDAFADAYTTAGGCLPDDWHRRCRTIDLANLVSLLGRSTPGSTRFLDLRTRVEAETS